MAHLEGRAQVGEGEEETLGWEAEDWDIGILRGAIVMTGEKTLHERTREVTQSMRRDMWRRQH